MNQRGPGFLREAQHPRRCQNPQAEPQVRSRFPIGLGDQGRQTCGQTCVATDPEIPRRQRVKLQRPGRRQQQPATNELCEIQYSVSCPCPFQHGPHRQDSLGERSFDNEARGQPEPAPIVSNLVSSFRCSSITSLCGRPETTPNLPATAVSRS